MSQVSRSLRKFGAAVLGAATVFCAGDAAWSQTVSPAPNAQVTSTQPLITVTFQAMVRNVRILIDGQDFSSYAKLNGNVVTLTPPYGLDMGVHKVTAEGTNLFGLPEATSWQFTISSPTQVPTTTNTTKPKGRTLSPLSYVPAANGVVESARPQITVEFPEDVRGAKLTVDNYDGSSQVIYGERRLSMTPTLNLIPGKHTAVVQAVGSTSGARYQGTWSFETRQPAVNLQPHHLNPPPAAVVKNSRPFVSADFPQPSVQTRFYFDQADYTSQVEMSSQRVSWNPPYDLPSGSHQVRVEGQTASGQPMTIGWTFQTQASTNTPVPPNPNPTTPVPPVPNTDSAQDLTVDEPMADDLVGDVFNLSGQAPASSLVKVTVKSLGLKPKTFEFKARADAAGFYQVPVSTRWATRGTILQMTVVAVNPKNGKRLAAPYGFRVTRK
jgi:hypothetical protein